jgi:nitroreductase
MSTETATPTTFPEIKRATTLPRTHELIAERWSPRAYSDRPVSNEDLATLFDAATWAASSFNEQPWRFIVGVKGDETWEKILSTLVPVNQSWAKNAPVLLITVAKKTFTHDGSPNRFGLHDTGAALANLMLQATALGLHGHAMAGLQPDKARELFHVPDDFEIGAAVAIGYLGDPQQLENERLRTAELSPRKRKSLDEVVFSGNFGKSAEL